MFSTHVKYIQQNSECNAHANACGQRADFLRTLNRNLKLLSLIWDLKEP